MAIEEDEDIGSNATSIWVDEQIRLLPEDIEWIIKTMDTKCPCCKNYGPCMYVDCCMK